MARELFTVRLVKADYDRYRLWCNLSDTQLAEGVGVLMDSCHVPTLEELQQFSERFKPTGVRRLDLSKDE